MPFGAVDASNGALHMIPGYFGGDQMEYLRGSHGEHNDPPQRALGIKQLPGRQVGRACPMRLGDVHFHHALTWHSSGRNSSGCTRHAHAVHYMPCNTRYVASRDHVMKQHVKCADGEMMSAAGPHFPRVTNDNCETVDYQYTNELQ
jgi:phytanoyl-CoA hydroxylase